VGCKGIGKREIDSTYERLSLSLSLSVFSLFSIIKQKKERKRRRRECQ
jgi:hypothetical protein